MSETADYPDYDDAEDYTDNASTFGDRIAAAREAIGMTPAQLARRLGIRTQTLLNWEEDRSEPRANRLQMLAGMLNISIIWLMSGQGEGPRPSLSAQPSTDRDVSAVLDELRDIRMAQTALTSRLSHLEKRLGTMLA